MASNFGIAIDKISDGFGLKLAGDFDATSAYELIYAIKKLPEDTVMLYIYTNGLKTIHSFGLDIFHKFMKSLKSNTSPRPKRQYSHWRLWRRKDASGRQWA